MASNIRSYSLNRLLLNCRHSLYKSRVCQYSSSVPDIKNDEVFDFESQEESTAELESDIEAKRNKSGLSEKHRNIVMGLPPTPGSFDFHTSLKYKRKMYGMYGSASGIDPGTLYPNKKDLEEIREYESVAHPYSVNEMINRAKNKRIEEENIILNRQKKIADGMKKLNEWMKEVEAKKEKKLKELAESKSKRDKLLDEVRRQIGYNVDMKDEKFKLALQQKEKDMKKQMKEEKKKAKQERILRMIDKEASGS